jgi:hypothetical protein
MGVGGFEFAGKCKSIDMRLCVVTALRTWDKLIRTAKEEPVDIRVTLRIGDAVPVFPGCDSGFFVGR